MAHFDHGLRGVESCRDAEFTRKLAEDLGLAFSAGVGDVAGLAGNRKISIQEAARILRYEFLEKVRVTNGLDLIATAHTADDQAEELLSRLIRGCGLQGLAGIPWKRDNTVIRPMLGIYSWEIRAFLSSCSISHVEDSSNLKRKYVRNRIRLDLIPYIRENFNPALKEGLNRTASLLAEDMQVLEAMGADAFAECVSGQGRDPESGTMELATEELLKRHPAVRRRVYRMALQQIGGLDGSITSTHLKDIDRIVSGINPSASLDLPCGIKAARRYARLVISVKGRGVDAHVNGFDFEVSGPGRYKLPGGCGEITIEESSFHQGLEPSNRKFPRPLFISAARVEFPVRVRSRCAGDRFSPLGRGYECRLKKFLINCKVPAALRDSMPLLVMNDLIIAVGGLEVSEAVSVEPRAAKCLIFTWSGQELI
jgi:tRNA(Ile)-lysidine synthase